MIAHCTGYGYLCGVTKGSETALIAPPIDAPVEISDDGLTAKQLAFVEHYVRYRNATQAYTASHDTNASYDTRANEGSRLLNRPEIQAAIKARAKIATYESGVDVGWILQRFLDIANADPRELIGLKIGCCRYCHGEGHGYQWREREYLEALAEVERRARLYPETAKDLVWPEYAGGFGFNATLDPVPECPQCHGEGAERFVPRDTDKLSDGALLLYGGVKVKKDGYEVVIADRTKAVELAGRILGAFNDKLRISGAIGHMHAVADLRSVDPQQAAAVYRDIIAGHLTA